MASPPEDGNRLPPPEVGAAAVAAARDATSGSQALLEVDAVSRSFGSTRALEGVSLHIAPGEIHGLCGQNGAGKSTLVKIISGQLRPDSGVLRLGGQQVHFTRPRDAQEQGIAIVDQELSIVPALTVEENVLLGEVGEGLLVHHGRSRPRVRALLERVGLGHLALRAPAETLSMAQRQLLEIARLLGRNARLLILDEPTASLSRGDSLVVFGALRELAAQGHSVLYVSHRLDEVLDLCHVITVVRDGKVVSSQPAHELDHAALVSQIIGAQHALEISHAAAQKSVVPTHHGEAVKVSVANLRVRDRVDGVSFALRPGEIVGLAGQVGSGASEVLRALAGLEADARGTLLIGGSSIRLGSPGRAARNGISFVSNDRKNEGLFLSRSVEHNLLATRLPSVSRYGVLRQADVRRHASALVEHVAVKTPSLAAAIGELSGGNQQKVFIGRALDRDPSHLLLLDEPTRGVDVRGRAEIHNLIKRAAAATQTAVLFVSGEPDEVLQLADRVLCMRNGTIVAEHPAGEMDEELLLAETTRSQEAAHVD